MYNRIVCILLVLLRLFLLCACASNESTTVQVSSEGGKSGNGPTQLLSNLIQKARDVLKSAVNHFLRFISNKVLPLLVSSDRSGFLPMDKQANIRMEEVASAINAKDKKALKALFSEVARGEDGDLDAEIDALFEFVPDEILSWNRSVSTEKITNEYGKKLDFFGLRLLCLPAPLIIILFYTTIRLIHVT